MKKIFIVLTGLILISMSYGQVQAHGDNFQLTKIENNILKDWIDCYKTQIPEFSIDGFSKTNSERFNTIQSEYYTIDFSVGIGNSLYKFSPDSSKYLSLDSYNILVDKDENGKLIPKGYDIDTETSVCDLKNKICTRILFFGSAGLPEDGFWINDNEILILGWDLGNGKNRVPYIWRIILDKQTRETYQLLIENKVDYNYQKKIRNRK
jgi:hypothetical protein